VTRTSRMKTRQASLKGAGPRNGAEAIHPRMRDRMRSVASIGYKTVDRKQEAVARDLGIDRRTWGKQTTGDSNSPLAAALEAVYLAALEAKDLNEADIVASFADALIKSIALRPMLERLSTEALVALLEDSYDHETVVQGQLDVLQGRRRARKRVDLNEERGLWARHAMYSERCMAILDVLDDRPDYLS